MDNEGKAGAYSEGEDDVVDDQDLNAFPQRQSSNAHGKDAKEGPKGGCYKYFHHGECPDHKLGKCEYDHSTEGMMEILKRKVSELVTSAHTPNKDYIVKLVERAVTTRDAKRAPQQGRKGT